jgi:hypothetical protein
LYEFNINFAPIPPAKRGIPSGVANIISLPRHGLYSENPNRRGMFQKPTR